MQAKRVRAYIIDLIIIVIAMALLSMLNIDNPDLNTKMDDLAVSYISSDITFSEYICGISSIYKQTDLNNIIVNILNIILIILYFVIIPYFNNGKTIGKQIEHIKVESSFLGLFVRSLIVNGLFYLISLLLCILIIPSNAYFITIVFLGIIQIGFFLISMIMLFYREDARGLHDIISGAKVVEE